MSKWVAVIFINFISFGTFSQVEKSQNFYQSATAKLADGDSLGSMVDLDSAVYFDKRHAKAYFLRAQIKQKSDDLRGALEEYIKVTEIEPDNSAASYQQALLYHELRDHRTYSINAINEAILYDRENPEFYNKRAYFRARTPDPYSGKLEYQKAINDMAKAISLNPQASDYYMTRADYRFEIDQHIEAIKDLDWAIRLDPTNPVYYGNRGLMKLLMEQYANAASDLTKAIRLNPTEEEYITNRGHANYNAGRTGHAVEDYTKSIRILVGKLRNEKRFPEIAKINDKLQDLYLIRGSAFIQMDRSGQACDDFYRAVELGKIIGLNYLRRYCGN
jgi:tetratricopeptide (TPR) repeat protein